MPGRHAKRTDSAETAPLMPNTNTGNRRGVAHRAGDTAVREVISPEREANRRFIERMLAVGRDSIVVWTSWPEGTQFDPAKDPRARQPIIGADYVREFTIQHTKPRPLPESLPPVSTEVTFALPVMVDEEREVTVQATRGILGLGIGAHQGIVTEKTGRKVPIMVANPETNLREPLYGITYSFGNDGGAAQNSLGRGGSTAVPTRMIGEIQVPESFVKEYEQRQRGDRAMGRDMAAAFVGVVAPEGQADAIWDTGAPFRPSYESPALSSPNWAVTLVSTRFTTRPDGFMVPMDPLVTTSTLGVA